jgi:hypothetical protein
MRILLLLFLSLNSYADNIDSDAISKASGLVGRSNQAGNVYTLSADRPNLGVSINGVKLVSGMGLTASASFTGTKEHTVLIGELPLTEAEVNKFLEIVLVHGLNVTALHNAFLFDKPRIVSLHFSGTGDELTLASAVGALFKEFAPNPQPKLTANPALHPEKITAILWKGESIDGVYRVSTGRGTEFAGITIGNSMGVSSYASFAGSDSAAVVTGDIAMLEYELPKVLKALIGAHITVTSIHEHMTQEVPKIVFIHYWGAGKIEDLARGVKAALVVQKNFQGST